MIAIPREPEPNPRHYTGTCGVCHTDHYLIDPAEGIGHTTACACGTAQSCEVCPTCQQCGGAVCPQCSVEARFGGRVQLVCSGCYQTFLDDTYTSVADPALIEPELPMNAHVHSHIAHMLNALASAVYPGVRR